MSNSVTLNDLPILPKDFCKQCPEEQRDGCLQCMQTTKHVATCNINEYGIQENTEYYGNDAKKCCAIELKRKTAT